MDASSPDPSTAFDEAIRQAGDCLTSTPLQALSLAQSALALLDDGPQDSHRRALGMWALGLAQAYAGHHAAGIATLEHALSLAPDEHTELRCRLLRGLSIAHEQLGALHAALQWALKALELARTLPGGGTLASALLSAGVARSRCGDAPSGLRLYHEARELAEAAGDKAMLLSIHNNIGINCKNLGLHEQAVQHLTQARELALGLGQPVMAGVANSNLGEPLWRLGRIDEAIEVLRQAVATLSGSGHRLSTVHANVMLGEVLLAQGGPGAGLAAQQHIEQGLAIAQQAGTSNYVARAHLALSAVHKAASRLDQALAHHEAYHAAERRQFNEDSARQLNALQVQHDLSEARLEAQTERRHHEQLRKAHEELQTLHQALVQADREKSELVRQLEVLSNSDPLTGLANRRRLDLRLHEDFERAHRAHGRLAVALCDLDDFKHINDHFGHATGDDVLRGVAELLRRHCRSIDLVARCGGEEFCILFADADGAAARRACEAFRRAVQQHDWDTLQPGLVVTVSIGMAEALTHSDPQALIAAADAQLYRAKRQGKNQVCSGEFSDSGT